MCPRRWELAVVVGCWTIGASAQAGASVVAGAGLAANTGARGADWLIRDMGSRNGTRVNGWLVKEQELRPADTLAFRASVFTFRP
jgi:hypothetical protein